MSAERLWPADTQPSLRYPLYTRGNVGEVFPNVMSVITGTLIGDEVNRASFALFEEMGFLRPRDLEPEPSATGVFAGYLYANASLFRLIGARTPGMRPEDAEQQVSGGAGDMPGYVPKPGDRDLIASLRLGLYMALILRRPDLTPLDVSRRDAQSWVDSLPPLSTASDADLLAFVATYPRRLRTSMNSLLRQGMVAGGPRAILDRLLDRAGAPPGTVNRLLSGIDDIDSTQLARRQWELSRIVARDAELTALFDAGSVRSLADCVGTALESPLTSFLADWGHRGSDEYELCGPSWSMDPSPVLVTVDRLRHVPDSRTPAAAMERLRAESEAADHEAMKLLARPVRAIARRAVAAARAGSVARERAKDILVLENSAVRLALRELYRRACERGGPDDPISCGCITWTELPDFVRDPLPFMPVIDERLALRRHLAERVPPPWFEGRIPDPSTWELRDGANVASPRAGSTLAGIAVSAGSAAGPARVITDPSDPRRLEPGEVLVCPVTDPSWTPLFLVASAVVSDTGAMLSHAAIVARELGIPAVMSVVGASAIEDGTWLEVDGDRGRVTLGRRPDV
jgi:pyruvate,water dikinase